MSSLGARATRTLFSSAICAVLCLGGAAVAQQAPSAQLTPDAPSAKSTTHESTMTIKERPGGAKNNFRDFAHQLFSPQTVLLPAATAGLSTAIADDNDHAFEKGATGFGHRYGVYLADTGAAKFLRAFAMPTIFGQVEGYTPVGPGHGFGKRVGHAIAHTFVTKTRNGNNTFNMSGVPASFAVGAIGTYYYPGRYDSNWHMAQRAAWMQAGYFSQDLWREFRPQICHATHLPCGKTKTTP
jgi:hypothetical protein